MMERDPDRLARKPFDLVVVGGGITGAALAWDASLRGLDVALVDKADFGAATSAATSKLIHGGLRYLKNGEVRLVRESLRERRILQTIAGHLVRPIAFMIPTYKRGGNKKWLIKAGMIAYDMLSWDRKRLEDPDQRLPGHTMLRPSQVAEAEPLVATDGLTGGAIYYDCKCEPERLTLEFILGAAARGAVVLNYTRADSVLCNQGRVEGIAVTDLLTGHQCEVRATVVANVAGPWADSIDVLCGAGEEVALQRSKGIHIVTRPLVRNHAVVGQTSQGGHFFLIPWRGHCLIGTTDTAYQGEPDDLSVLDTDVETFLDEINGAYPAAGLTPGDVLYRYVGVRPLVDQETQVYKASRKYEIVDHHKRGLKGFLTAMGGKYTTSRNLAQKITDRVAKRLDRPVAACQTARRLLPGGVAGSFSGYLREQVESNRGLLELDILEHLVWTYGARHGQVLELVRRDAGQGERLAEGRPEILAQVTFAIEKEMARTLCDILVRRTGFGTLGPPGDAALDKVAAEAAARLGWDGARIEREKEIFLGKIRGRPEPAPSA